MSKLLNTAQFYCTSLLCPNWAGEESATKYMPLTKIELETLQSKCQCSDDGAKPARAIKELKF